MTRSHRKTPIFGNAAWENEKQDKRRANRKLRRVNKGREEPILPEEAYDIYDMAKDGKRYIRRPQKEWMRK